MKKYTELAEHLFELEIERISNDPEFHFGDLGNNWIETYGEKSIKFADDFKAKKSEVKELADMLKEDFENGEWTPDEEGGLYHYLMPDFYGGFICNCIETQLANFTGVGVQLEMF